MANTQQKSELVEQMKKTLSTYLKWWLIPTIAVGFTGSFYAFFLQTPKWKAWQVLHVRDEVAGNQNGRFGTVEERQAAQETIIELSRSQEVIKATLRKIGPGAKARKLENWPSAKDIAGIQRVVKVSAPKGSEFGKTDVIYLSATQRTPADASSLVGTLTEQLMKRSQALRILKAESIISELTQKHRVTGQNLENATRRLKKLEEKVGSDLGELRTLAQSGSGESNLRTAVTQINNDIRVARRNQTAQKELLQILRMAQKEPYKLIATPAKMLESNSALRKLREGLVDAQLKVAQLSGKMSPSHPAVKSAVNSEQKIRQQIQTEVPAAINSVLADSKVTSALIDSLELELSNYQRRLNQLANLRAVYSNLTDEVTNLSQQLSAVRESLANAQTNQNASESASLITRVGGVKVSDSPVGPGKTVIAAGSWIGGLFIGLGLVLLISPGLTSQNRLFGGRRATDSSQEKRVGRRASDRNRRSTDKTEVVTEKEEAEPIASK